VTVSPVQPIDPLASEPAAESAILNPSPADQTIMTVQQIKAIYGLIQRALGEGLCEKIGAGEGMDDTPSIRECQIPEMRHCRRSG
jgi:hypothetical protein